MVHLTRCQQEIADCESKYCLVTASARSGKALVLAKRIEKLLGSLRRGEKILALTYTSKAARELRGRLLDAHSEEELASKVLVDTIRSFCARFVARRGSTIGLPYGLHVLENVEDRLAIFADAVEAVPQVRASINDMRTLKQLFEDVERAKRSWTFRSQFFEDTDNRMVFDEYRAEMLNRHAIDLDDTLAYAAQILIERPSLATLYQGVYRYICIDDAQDLNDAQYQVIQALAGGECGIMMVGDSRQATYVFNGSTVSIMMERFPKDHHPVIQFTLEEHFAPQGQPCRMRGQLKVRPT
jgi:DNA helicase-2/ATP-dependent DNA helicase PcrA